MKILITGAEIVEQNKQFNVVYKGRVVACNPIKDCAMVMAMQRDLLEELLQASNIYQLRAA